MIEIDIMDCGEICCEYCSKEKCIYMTDNKAEMENKEETLIEKLEGEARGLG